MRRDRVEARAWWCAALLCSGSLSLAAPPVAAQPTGALQGSVRAAQAPYRPIVQAQVVVLDQSLRTVTDSSGQFMLVAVPAGEQVVVIRAPGFVPDTLRVTIPAGQTLRKEMALRSAVTTLEGVRVEAEAVPLSSRLSGFEERRRFGVGRFLDRAAIAKWDERRLGELLRTVPGLRVHNGGSRSWVSSGRAVSSGAGAFTPVRRRDVLDRADDAAGAPLVCYLDVYVDGVMVYNSSSFAGGAGVPGGGTPLFNVNSIPPATIEAIEVYNSTAQIPAAYNRTNGGCGVMLIWTR